LGGESFYLWLEVGVVGRTSKITAVPDGKTPRTRLKSNLSVMEGDKKRPKEEMGKGGRITQP